jgi:hypothetical protein
MDAALLKAPIVSNPKCHQSILITEVSPIGACVIIFQQDLDVIYDRSALC